MGRFAIPSWATLALTIVASTAAGTWVVRDVLDDVQTEQKALRDATRDGFRALYNEVCAIRQAVDVKGLSQTCGADGRPDLLPVGVSRAFARVPEPSRSLYLWAYLGIGACTVGSVCLLLFAQRFGAWADRRQLEERVASLERWRAAECPDHLPPDEEMTA